MSWNYRMIVIEKGTDEEALFMHEIYYEEDGSIRAWSKDPCVVVGNSQEEVASRLVDMALAVYRPVLIEVDEKLVEVKK